MRLAGQRRRRRTAIATSAAIAGAAAVAVVALTVAGGPGAGHDGSHGGALGAARTVALQAPVTFGQVAGTSAPPCRAGADLMPHTAGTAASCFRFTGTGMTITRVESVRVQRNPLGRYQLEFRLAPADARLFAALTRRLAGLHSPRNQLAIVVNGRVLADLTVRRAITAGQAVMPGLPTKPQAEFLLATLLGG
jgi:hypothetical protein